MRQVFRKNKRRKESTRPRRCVTACLKTCADQLAPIFTQLFNRSLELCEVPSCFKRSTIIPVPKKKPKLLVLMTTDLWLYVCGHEIIWKKLDFGLSDGHHWDPYLEPPCSLPTEQTGLWMMQSTWSLHFILQHLDRPRDLCGGSCLWTSAPLLTHHHHGHPSQ